MPQVTETELKKQLDAESFAPVYFFYGPETYIVSSFVKRFLKKGARRYYTEDKYHEA